jgi:hypothetical protein
MFSTRIISKYHCLFQELKSFTDQSKYSNSKIIAFMQIYIQKDGH